MDELLKISQDLGELKGTIKGVESFMERQDKNIGKLFDVSSEISIRIEKLPCAKHSEDLEKINTWKDGCDNTKQAVKVEEKKGKESRKTTIIAYIIAGVFAVIAAAMGVIAAAH